MKKRSRVQGCLEDRGLRLEVGGKYGPFLFCLKPKAKRSSNL